MAVTGAIADAARSELPLTWAALLGDSRFGEAQVQAKIDLIKEKITGEVVDPEMEATLYTRRLIDYMGKLTALELIQPGIDYWMSQPTSMGTTGTEEQTAWTNRADELRQLREYLLLRTRALESELLPELPFRRPSHRKPPLVSSAEDELLSPSYLDFGRKYVDTGR